MRLRGLATVALVAVMTVTVALPIGAQESFADVEADAYYSEAVAWMIDQGLTTGSADGLYRPTDPVTRGEMAVFLWRLVGEPPAPVHGFTDVTVGWQDDAVAWMADSGITQGSSPTTFDPAGTVSRGDLAVFLYRLAGEPATPPHNFRDVPSGLLDIPVSWISATGISTGVAPLEFGPELPVIRGQAAVFLQRFEMTGVLARVVDDPVGEPVSPVTTVAEAAKGPVVAATPTSPRVGERLIVAGSGVTPGDVLVTVGDEVAGVTQVGANGSFALEIVLPELDAGQQVVAVVQSGSIIGSAEIDVRAEAPSGGWFFPVLLLLAALAGVGYWWWNYGLPARLAGDDETEDQDVPVEAPEAVSEAQPIADALSTDLMAVYPVKGIKPDVIETLSAYEGTVFGTVRSEFEGADHALVVRSLDQGQSWDVVADLGPGYVGAIAVSGSDAVAFGSRFVPEEHGLVRKATMWHSNDLKTWVSVNLAGDGFKDAGFDGVAAIGDVLVAYGRNHEGPCMWTGSDHGWKTRRMPGPIDSLVETAKGGYLFGRDPERRAGVVLHSRDGSDWEQVDHPSAVMFDTATVLSVADFQGGVVAAGFDNLRGVAAVWVSDDAQHWHRSPMDFDDQTGIERLVVVGDQLVAVGTTRAKAHASRASDIAIWTSPDAVSWSSVDDGGLGASSRMNGAVATEAGVLISGERLMDASASGAPVIWSFFGAELEVRV